MKLDTEPERTLKISKIKEGTVIDHIPAGKALKVLSILGIDEKVHYSISVGMFVQSKRIGYKDVVKIEARFLERDELDRISLVAPEATISIIRNYSISEKFTVKLPERIVGIIPCKNQNCITNSGEPVNSEFVLKSTKPLVVTCVFCERNMSEGEIHSAL